MIFENISECSELQTLEPEMERMEKEGIWKRLERDFGKEYRRGKRALFHTYRKV